MHRLYIDETGHADLKASHDPNQRFLSLTGVVLSIDYVRLSLFPSLEHLKSEFFESHPDAPVVLHRKDMLARKHPFHRLRDANVERAFNARFIKLLEEMDYAVITVVIDKQEHLNRYKVWRYEPYHYCLEMMLERYVRWLRARQLRGDVMAEARGGKPDRKLEACYARIYAKGTSYLKPDVFTKHLTSGQLKLKRKAQNVAGLQLADVLAHPSAQWVRHKQVDEGAPRGLGARIADILLASKYDRDRSGKIDGWGIKWLP